MKLTAYGIISELPGGDEAHVTGLQSQERILTALLDEYHRERQRVANDWRLTNPGKVDALRKLRDAACGKLNAAHDSYSKPLNADRTRSEQLRAQLWHRLDFDPTACGGFTSRVPDSERPVAELRARELRDRLLAMDPLQRLTVALDAAQANDRETLAAIANAPRAFKVLSDEHQAQVDQVHIRMHHDDVVKELQTLDAYILQVESNEATARGSILGDSRRGAADTIADMAAGTGSNAA